MCGLIVLINKKSLCDRKLLSALNNLCTHRGPDASGIYLNGPLGMAHRRLSILDLSGFANQPFSFQDRYLIVYNGEIFNFIEIRQELISFGYQFITNSDTEVILAAYSHYGEHCVSKFNGMWAFAIYDKKLNTLFFSRDRFGEKPLYYIDTP